MMVSMQQVSKRGGHPLNDDVTTMVLTPQNCGVHITPCSYSWRDSKRKVHGCGLQCWGRKG